MAHDVPRPRESEILTYMAAQHGADVALEGLTRAINALPEVGISVTLLVGGVVVSGTIEGGESWFEAQRAAVEAGHAGFGEMFDPIIEQYRDGRESEQATLADDRDDEDRERTITAYVHLRDVRLWSPGGGYLNVSGGMRWRCRLAAVDGWMLGSFSEG